MRGTIPHTPPSFIAQAVQQHRLNETHDMLVLALDVINSRYGCARPLAIHEAESYLRAALRNVDALSAGGADRDP